MLGHIFAHKFTQHLRGWLILRPANLQELLAQLALNSNAKTGIFHGYKSVPNGYTFV